MTGSRLNGKKGVGVMMTSGVRGERGQREIIGDAD